MKKLNLFQIVVLGIFVALLFLGFLAFTGRLPLPSTGSDSVNYGTVTIWGTIPAQVVQPILVQKLSGDKRISIKYVEKNKATFANDFVQALASGRGPDLFILSQDEILRNIDKVSLIPYTALSERDFKDTFIEEGEMFLRPEGIIAVPFTVDPMVMYWNRDIFSSVSIVAPPQKWGELYSLAPRIVLRNQAGDITRSLVSLGEYQNVLHAKEILSTLIMQAGSPIVSNIQGVTADLLSGANTEKPAERAVSFFMEFARPNKDSYSWNRSLPYSRSMFETGDLALYFGYASEYALIKAHNPHLNFDIAVMPQADQTTKRLTFGQMQAIAAVRSSSNPQGAQFAQFWLADQGLAAAIAEKLALPPVQRNLFAKLPTDAVFSVLYDSALIAHAWADPSPAETDQLFQNMISDISSGRFTVSQALGVAQASLGKLIADLRQSLR